MRSFFDKKIFEVEVGVGDSDFLAHAHFIKLQKHMSNVYKQMSPMNPLSLSKLHSFAFSKTEKVKNPTLTQ